MRQYKVTFENVNGKNKLFLNGEYKVEVPLGDGGSQELCDEIEGFIKMSEEFQIMTVKIYIWKEDGRVDGVEVQVTEASSNVEQEIFHFEDYVNFE